VRPRHPGCEGHLLKLVANFSRKIVTPQPPGTGASLPACQSRPAPFEPWTSPAGMVPFRVSKVDIAVPFAIECSLKSSAVHEISGWRPRPKQRKQS
jgi:hypothetical protein